jgi:hypothetical protein
MNKATMIPTLALAAIIGVGMTVPDTASATERPDRKPKVERDHRKGDRQDHGYR